ncbi:hypothetical protein ACFOEQ_04245 [Chryseobacterium arachidis]
MHVDTEDLISENAEIPYVDELTETALHKKTNLLQWPIKKSFA